MSPGCRYAWSAILLLCLIAGALIVYKVRLGERTITALNLATQRKEQARQRMTLAEQKLARAVRESAAKSTGVSISAGTTAGAFPTAAKAGTEDEATMGPGGTAKLSARDVKRRPEVVEAIDPVLRALNLQVFDAQFHGIWGPMLQQLSLPKEKEAALKALMRTHEERRQDVTAVAGEHGLELGDPAIQKMRRADGALHTQEVLLLLGPEDARIYEQFRRDMAVQAPITDLAVANYRTSTPLTYAESLQLRSILAANSERTGNGIVRPGAINWEAALSQIASSETFSAATVEGFRHQVADQQMHQQISQRRQEIETRMMSPLRGEIGFPNLPALAPTRSTAIPEAR